MAYCFATGPDHASHIPDEDEVQNEVRRDDAWFSEHRDLLLLDAPCDRWTTDDDDPW
jgi:hypothetical protein